MKRFWVFVIILIVALGFGFTIFRFMSQDEVLYVQNTVYEVNSGENIKLNIVAKNLKNSTTISAVSNNSSIIEQVADYEFKAKNGGTTTITVSSNKGDFQPVEVQVTVGDGLLTTPFFIRNAEELAKIGTAKVEDGESYIYPLTRNYKLVADFAITGDNWVAIGANDDAGFTGLFDFNGHKIDNLHVTNGSFAGLFSKIGIGGEVKGAKLSNVSLTANADYSGAIAGVNLGRIDSADITNVSILNAKANAKVGGLVGLNSGIITKSTVKNSGTGLISATGEGSVAGGIAGTSVLDNFKSNASISRSSASVSISAVYAVGGIVGQNTGAVVENCYAGTLEDEYIISTNATAFGGGVVGINEYKTFNESTEVKSSVADTYSVMHFSNSNSTNVGAIIGKNDNLSTDVEYNVLYGNYYSNEINPGLAGIGQNSKVANTSEIETKGVTTAELKQQTTFVSYSNLKWQFAEGVWTINEAVDAPKLSYVVSYISSRVQGYKSETDINSYSDFMRLKDENVDIRKQYVLKHDIELFSERGYVPFAFNGKLTCPLVDGEPQFKIILHLTTTEGVSDDGVAAVFSTLGQNAQISNIKVQVVINNSANHIAALAGYNLGGIENCSATGTITTENSSGDLFIAGLVAENKGNIRNSKSNVTINYTASPRIAYIGGIAGYSSGKIDNSTNNGSITATANTELYVGGVVGYSTSSITKCANHGAVTGNISATNAYFGGITGYLSFNADAKMVYCGSYAELKGSNVGGLVGVSIGQIESCYSCASISGVYVGGLAYNIKQGTAQCPAFIKNSMTDGSMLWGENNKSVICGVVYQIDVSEDHRAYCEKIFSSSKFSGDGKMYFETQSNIRGSNKTGTPGGVYYYIDADAFNNSIYVERNGNIERSMADFSWSWENIFQHDFIGKGKLDIQVTEAVAKGTDGGFAIFTTNNYSSSIWLFDVGNYPQIIGVAK